MTSAPSSVSVATTSNGMVPSATGISQAHSSSSVSTTASSGSTASVAATPPPTPAPQTPVPSTPTPPTTSAGTQSQSPPSGGGPIRQKSWELLDQQAMSAARKASSVPQQIQNPVSTEVNFLFVLVSECF